jgi:hypothetical protein
MRSEKFSLLTSHFSIIRLSPLQEKKTKKETVRQRCEIYFSQIPDIFS